MDFELGLEEWVGVPQVEGRDGESADLEFRTQTGWEAWIVLTEWSRLNLLLDKIKLDEQVQDQSLCIRPRCFY